MQARDGVIDYLNRHLTVELTAINQYFLQSEMARNWGFERLYTRLRELSMEEMKDAEVGVLVDGSGWTWKTQTQKPSQNPGWTARVLRRMKRKER